MDWTNIISLPVWMSVLLVVLGVLSLFYAPLRVPGRFLTRLTKFGNPMLWSIILFVGLGFISGGVTYLLNVGLPAAVDNVSGLTGDSSNDLVCPDTQRTVKFTAQDAFASTAVTGNHLYRTIGADGKENPAVSVANDGTATLYVGSKVHVMFGAANTTGSYFSKDMVYEVPCYGDPTASASLYSNGTLTFEVFNEEGNLIDTTQENETIGSGDVVTLRSNLKGTYQKGFPHGGVLIVEYNQTEYDKVVADFGGSKKVATPGFFTVSSTANTAAAYEIPPILSNQILSGTITMDAKSVNPGDTNDPKLYFVPYNYYTDEDNGGAFSGPAAEDQNAARTYGHQTVFTLSVD